jgi:hypothetical protein
MRYLLWGDSAIVPRPAPEGPGGDDGRIGGRYPQEPRAVQGWYPQYPWAVQGGGGTPCPGTPRTVGGGAGPLGGTPRTPGLAEGGGYPRDPGLAKGGGGRLPPVTPGHNKGHENAMSPGSDVYIYIYIYIYKS